MSTGPPLCPWVQESQKNPRYIAFIVALAYIAYIALYDLIDFANIIERPMFNTDSDLAPLAFFLWCIITYIL